MIRTKRVYDPPTPEDGRRILVDRLWPRGLTRDRARLDEWRKELGPTDDLRKWYGHEPMRFAQFRARYRRELLRHPEALADLLLEAEKGTVTLLYAARDRTHSNAAVLKELLDESLR